MHIPGHGFITLPTSIAAALAAAGGLGAAIRGAGRGGASTGIAMRMALVAAIVFAAQMFNYPITGGTSGHLIGAAFAAAVLGPFAASIVIAAVLLVQCALFGDGGWFSLGANVLNMGLIATWVGWAFYRGLWRAEGTSRYLALFIGSWASVVAAASACSVEIAASGAAPLGKVLPAMVLSHATIGVGEGLITVAAFALVSAFMPSLKARWALKQGA